MQLSVLFPLSPALPQGEGDPSAAFMVMVGTRSTASVKCYPIGDAVERVPTRSLTADRTADLFRQRFRLRLAEVAGNLRASSRYFRPDRRR